MLLDLLLAALFLLPVVVLATLGRRKGRRWTGVRLLVVAPLLMPMAEDGFLAVWYALATPAVDTHGVRGLVHPHALGHLFGAGVAAIVLGLAAAWVAHRHLRAGASWAWHLLLGIGVPVVAVGLVELTLFYGHGLPTTATETGSFGWPLWAAGVVAWGAGLVMTRPGCTDDGPPIDEESPAIQAPDGHHNRSA